MLLPPSADFRVRSYAVALFAMVLALSTLASPQLTFAHDGHDHEPAATTLPMTISPRAVATGDEFEAVAVLKSGELLIFVDRFADNSPVTNAAVLVTVGNREIKALPAPNGIYRIAWPPAAKSGRHDVVMNIQDGATADLLIATIEIPLAAASLAVEPAAGLRARVQHWFGGSPIVFGLVALSLMALATFLVRGRIVTKRNHPPEPVTAAQRSKISAPRTLVALLVLGVSILSDRSAHAHGGEDHGDEPPVAAAATGEAPRRLPDGSVFVPKPTQRLLDVRTVLAKEAPQQPSQTFIGRVIANPNRSGLVQSSTGGRITPTGAGLPKLGQAVKAGDILAIVTPAFLAIDSANVSQTAGDLEQQIELARTRLERAKRLAALNAGPRVQAEEAELTLRGLERRRAALNTSQVRSEPLVAPVDGVISSTRAVPGQVVAPQDVLFEIIDPASLWVEALVFDTASGQKFEQPTASSQDGRTFSLTFVGRSRSLRQQSAILQFEITSPAAALDVGTPVTVHAQAGEPITAIVLPRAAVVRSANGEDVVWRHTEPERFVPTPVKITPFDGARVLVQAGLSAGQRIVVQSAELISQMR